MRCERCGLFSEDMVPMPETGSLWICRDAVEDALRLRVPVDELAGNDRQSASSAAVSVAGCEPSCSRWGAGALAREQLDFDKAGE